MRRIGGLAFGLLVLGWLAAVVPLPDSEAGRSALTLGTARWDSARVDGDNIVSVDNVSVDNLSGEGFSWSRPQAADSTWRHTRNGWERCEWWESHEPLPRPALHPLVVGTLQLLISVAALMFCSSTNGRKSPVVGTA